MTAEPPDSKLTAAALIADEARRAPDKPGVTLEDHKVRARIHLDEATDTDIVVHVGVAEIEQQRQRLNPIELEL